ncbi:MAG: hypothetical protein RMJ43_07820 [Chloroherpetonaceae bacterium]|nr:hypothetical protein [Chthonomonadaceae bacterium]MDW8207730.1 hypothetical protein [Chloroherpetonaceae bacterium]
MSIPQRLARIARHKLNEVREHIARLDEVMAHRELELEQQRQQQEHARRELQDTLQGGGSVRPVMPPRGGGAPVLRSPQEIAGGAAPAPQSAVPGTQGDPLVYHYRLLGVEPGSDFSVVRAAYNRLSARCDPARFPAGSAEEQEARRIRERLEASYRALRDALDPTARRFGLLDFDAPRTSS